MIVRPAFPIDARRSQASLARRGLLVLFLALLSATPLLAAGRAQGVFLNGGLKVTIVDAYAHLGKADFGRDEVILVRLSTRPLDHAAIDAALDRPLAFAAQVTSAPSLTLQFDKQTGAWLGSSYSIASGNNCGYCSAPSVPGGTLKLEGGALKGRLHVKTTDHSDGDGAGADIQFDLPISAEAKTTPLGVGGGEPGQAFVACHTAVAKREKAAFRKYCAVSLQSLEQAEMGVTGEDASQAVESFFTSGLYEDALKLTGMKVTGGRALATEAELLVEGKNLDMNSAHKGRVYMKRTPTGWVYDHAELETVY